MKAGRNRLGRTDHPRRERAAGDRSQRRLRGVALCLAGAALALSLAAAPAGAGPGGATTVASTDARSGRGLAFSSLRTAGATWYGPGLYGNRTACGQVLRPGTVGVAHRRLPCGTPVKFVHRGRSIVTRVIDRGPYARGKAWDLTNGARRALRFAGSGRIRYAVGLRYTRRPRGTARRASAG